MKNLSQQTKESLVRMALRLGIKSPAAMNKADLIKAIAKARKSTKPSKTKKKTNIEKPKASAAAKKRPGRKPAEEKTTPKPGRSEAAPKPKTRKKAPSKPALKKPAAPPKKRVAKTPPRRHPPRPSAEKTIPPIPILPPSQPQPFDIEVRLHEAATEKAKYDLGPVSQEFPPPAYVEELGELPSDYGDNIIVLLPRDPQWVFAFWELTPQIITETLSKIPGARSTLRLYDVTGVSFDGTNALSFVDIDVSLEARNWYINVPAKDRSYCADIGFKSPAGWLATLARSNVVELPPDAISESFEERYATIPFETPLREIAARILRAPIAPGRPLTSEEYQELYASILALEPGMRTEEMLEHLHRRLRTELFSGSLSRG